MTIDAFRGRWTKLGNYSSCVVFYEGHAYQSVEHAYQAQKSLDPGIQKMIRDQPTPATAKKVARSVQLRPDWEDVKIPIMRTLLREKFCQEPERSILLSTGDQELIEGNWWNDRFWGQCPVGTGENWLGRLLMEVRTELRASEPHTCRGLFDTCDICGAPMHVCGLAGYDPMVDPPCPACEKTRT